MRCIIDLLLFSSKKEGNARIVTINEDHAASLLFPGKKEKNSFFFQQQQQQQQQQKRGESSAGHQETAPLIGVVEMVAIRTQLETFHFFWLFFGFFNVVGSLLPRAHHHLVLPSPKWKTSWSFFRPVSSSSSSSSSSFEKSLRFVCVFVTRQRWASH